MLSSSASLRPPWTVTRQAPLSVGLSQQEYWSGLPFPPPGDHPDLGTEPRYPVLAGRFFTSEPSGKLLTISTSLIASTRLSFCPHVNRKMMKM